jgi:hypothetical protein
MGCRCRERTDALHRARQAVVRGEFRAAAGAIGFVGRTLIEDARSGDLRAAAGARLNAMKARAPRR